MRKIRRRVFFRISFSLIVMGLLVYFLYFSRTKDLDKHLKIEIIERSIRSVINQDECRMPHLPIDHPDIMKFYKPTDRLDCGKASDDWVMCEKSVCFVKPEVSAIHDDIVCSYTDLIRKDDYRVRYGKTTKTREPYILQQSDFVKVVCSTGSGQSWFGMAYGIRDGVSISRLDGASNPISVLQEHPLDDVTRPSYFNVLIFGFDSLSRNAFMRKLPKTYDYLIKQLNAVVLEGYNIVGDGTPQALIPLLTGYTELELPETRKRMSDALTVDVAYPMIWSDYEQHGYVTSFNEDVPSTGTFTYRMRGFKVQPVHHYLRTFYLEAQNIWSPSKANCIGHQPDHQIMLDYTKYFMAKYSDTPRFVFSFHGGLSHDSINLIGAADDDVAAWLDTLKQKRLLDNTITVFMADHGNRFSKVRETLQGKQEERLPFFSFAFPTSFKEKFPQEFSNFVENSKLLTTPFDVHATLKHILTLQVAKSLRATKASSHRGRTELLEDTHTPRSPPRLGKVKLTALARDRAISLFKQVPRNRSCAEAYIEPHWCACLNWQPLALNDTSHMGPVLKAAASIISVINNATQPFRRYCSILQLESINWAMLLRPHKALLAYKQNSDIDGFLADMSDTTYTTEEFYQLQIVASPGGSLFEASVRHDLHTFNVQTKLSQVSRINKYGSQADCIYERNPELRKYCYCTTQ